jgi:hypothetical protein
MGGTVATDLFIGGPVGGVWGPVHARQWHAWTQIMRGVGRGVRVAMGVGVGSS